MGRTGKSCTQLPAPGTGTAALAPGREGTQHPDLGTASQPLPGPWCTLQPLLIKAQPLVIPWGVLLGSSKPLSVTPKSERREHEAQAQCPGVFSYLRGMKGILIILISVPTTSSSPPTGSSSSVRHLQTQLLSPAFCSSQQDSMLEGFPGICANIWVIFK